MKRQATAVLASALFVHAALAHEGHDHEPEAPVRAGASERPFVDTSGRLHVSKAVQHQLAIRTQAATADESTRIRAVGEVLPLPERRGSLQAPQAGRLEPAGAAWPLPGQAVRDGEVLAILRPQTSSRERARRGAALALIEQKLTIAKVNVDRLRIQAAANGGTIPNGNFYLEQAEADYASLEQMRAGAVQGMEGRAEIRATTTGHLASVRAFAGDVVATGDALFEIVDASHARIAVTVFDAAIAQRLTGATLGDAPLALRGTQPEPGGIGWQLLLDQDQAPPRALAPGQLVDVELKLEPARAACSATWVHAEPEVFERRTGDACRVQVGERRVVQGGALLDAYLDGS